MRDARHFGVSLPAEILPLAMVLSVHGRGPLVTLRSPRMKKNPFPTGFPSPRSRRREDGDWRVENWLMGLVVANSAFVLIQCSPAGAQFFSRCLALVALL
jgi:hypothetical protein